MKRASVEDLYALSPLQQGMLFHLLGSPESGAYFEQLVCSLAGEVAETDLERAWKKVVERHPVLRTSFVWQGVREPLQVVHRQVEVRLECHDWRALEASEREARWRELLAEDLARGFNLTRAPLARWRLVRWAEDDSRLLWSYPHLLLDGWSLPLLLEELFEFYAAFRRGEEPDPPRPRPYRDYILWLQGRDLAAAEEFWRGLLAGLEAPTRLDLGAEAGPPRLAARRNLALRLSPEATAELQQLARRGQVSLSTVTQAAFALLLARYGGGADVVFGTTLSARPPELAGVERMVGLFINTVPVRVRLQPGEPLADLLRRLQGQQNQIQLHGHAALRDIRRWAGIGADGEPFEVLLVFENYPLPAAGAGWLAGQRGLVLQRVAIEERTNYPFTLGVLPGARLALLASYDSWRFEPRAIERLLSHLECLLQAMAAADGGCPAVELCMLREAELHQVTREWSWGPGDGAELDAGQLIADWARRQPDRTAVVCGDEHLSYGALAHSAGGLAHLLRSQGVVAEVVAAIYLAPSIAAAVAVLGVLAAGGTFLPLDPELPGERLALMLDDSRAAVVLTAPPVAAPLPASRARRTDLAATVLRELACLPAPACGGGGADSLAYVIYTSGSTGRPKGVQLCRRGLGNLTPFYGAIGAVAPGDRVLQFASPSFDAAVSEIFMALGQGATLVYGPPDLRLAALDSALLRELAISVLTLPPSLLSTLPAGSLPALRTLIVAGEACPQALVDRWAAPGRRLINGYGPTESTVGTTAALCVAGGGKPPIGRPLPNLRVYLVDRWLRPVPAGVAGELLLGGAGLARGYLRRPALTAASFLPDPWCGVPGARVYRTGDLARWLPDGSLDFLGRRDHQVKLRGFRIELGEIEAVLLEHPAVSEAAVVPDGNGLLTAYWAARPGCEDAEVELRALLGRRLPAYMIPAVFMRLPALPRTMSGKLARGALPRPQRPASQTPRVEPRSALERTIAGLWRELLSADAVGVEDSFFDLGGHSLLLIRLHTRLQEVLGQTVPLRDLLRYPTVGALARHLAPPAAAVAAQPAPSRPGRSVGSGRPAGGTLDRAVAVVGMAGRFPGASDLAEFWRNLRGGVESISFFTAEELAAEGVDPALLRDPRFVPASGVVADAERFDAGFFGLRPREAETLDPQQRLLLECAWEALEDAGYAAGPGLPRTGVFAGTSLNHYGYRLYSRPELWRAVGSYQATIANNREFATTRISYRLNLTGPSVNVQTACSTSLVAVHLACQSLLAGECDMALAGGASIDVERKRGYLFEEDSIQSPDGHCRAFDADARGTVTGEGVGLVVLRRLAEAQADGDAIRAVIRGSACNNDGGQKIGYTAPSVAGQAEVISEALALAAVEPATIAYVEAHGTGTALGDPMEVAALSEAFGERGAAAGRCALGSVKTNIGHADAAAGIAGLIKTVLALEHRLIPPSLHFRRPNPEIDFARSGFFVNTEAREWPTGGTLRRAGVSSFGIGGTNVHCVLEEAPPAAPAPGGDSEHLIALSARTAAALEAASHRLAEHLRQCPELDLGDVASTLLVGRRWFAHRRVVLCREGAEAATALAARTPRRLFTAQWDGKPRPVAFLFPGQGAQRPNAGRRAYQQEPYFREVVDRCAALLLPWTGSDLRLDLFPRSGAEAEAAWRLQRTDVAQLALFVVEYAFARLLIERGVTPLALLGHSLGEYVAACLAGVFPLEAALGLVAARGRLMQRLPAGVMLAVALGEEELTPLLGEELALAAVNAPWRCVVSGAAAAVAELERRLAARGVAHSRLATSHAFHSPMVEPIQEAFAAEVRKAAPQPPTLPLVSNLTGTWMEPAAAADPAYWVRHLRAPVRFASGVAALLAEPDRVLVEVGPGQALAGLVRRQAPGATVVACTSGAGADGDLAPAHEVWGRLWALGAGVDVARLHAGARRRRVPLPTYPFERQRYWIEAPPRDAGGTRPRVADRREPSAWFYLPHWQPSPRPPDGAAKEPAAVWVLLGAAGELTARLVPPGVTAIEVQAGERLRRLGERSYLLDPRRRDQYEELLRDLAAQGRLPSAIVHLWSLAPPDSETRGFAAAQELGLYSLLALAQALARCAAGQPLTLTVVSDHLHSVQGEPARPEVAPLAAACMTIRQEYPNLLCRSVDVEPLAAGWRRDRLLGQLAAELRRPGEEASVAFRDGRRFGQAFAPIRLERPAATPARLRQGGAYLITGGLGRIGLLVAEHLARTCQARLILNARSPLPPRADWEAWIAGHGADDAVSRRIAGVRACEAAGGLVLIGHADLADRVQMRQILAAGRERYGPLHGIFHAAGWTGEAASRPVADTDPAFCQAHFRGKVEGLMVLDELVREGAAGGEPELWVLFSSLSSVLGGVGHAAYAAANRFLDAFAREQARAGRGHWLSIGWDGWESAAGDTGPISPAAGIDTLERALGLAGEPELLVSTTDLATRVERAMSGAALARSTSARAAAHHPRPALAVAYSAPHDGREHAVAQIWEELLGIQGVGIDDDFLALGGDSLLATELMARVRRHFAVDLPLRSFLAAPTVAGLAAAVADAQAGGKEQEEGETERILREIEALPDDALAAELDRLAVEDGLR
jgi:polyketide synthase PksJ